MAFNEIKLKTTHLRADFTDPNGMHISVSVHATEVTNRQPSPYWALEVTYKVTDDDPEGTAISDARVYRGEYASEADARAAALAFIRDEFQIVLHDPEIAETAEAEEVVS